MEAAGPDREPEETAEEQRRRKGEPWRGDSAEQGGGGERRSREEREPSDPDERGIVEAAGEEQRAETDAYGRGDDRDPLARSVHGAGR